MSSSTSLHLYDRWLAPQVEAWLTPRYDLYDRWLTHLQVPWLTPQYAQEYDLWLTPQCNQYDPVKYQTPLKTILPHPKASISLRSSMKRNVSSVMPTINSWNGRRT